MLKSLQATDSLIKYSKQLDILSNGIFKDGSLDTLQIKKKQINFLTSKENRNFKLMLVHVQPSMHIVMLMLVLIVKKS
jgi:hypothetical protein